MIGVEDGRGHEVGWAAEKKKDPERDCRRTENQDKGECRGWREGGEEKKKAESGEEAETAAAAAAGGAKSSKKVP